MKIWQIQDAKARLSEVIRQAQQEGPQTITIHGEPKAIVLASQDYEKLQGNKPNLWAFLRASPLNGIELEIERDKTLPRDISL